jgi:bacillithiol synthase
VSNPLNPCPKNTALTNTFSTHQEKFFHFFKITHFALFHTHTLPYADLPSIAARDRAFLTQNPNLQAFTPYTNDWSGFEASVHAHQQQPKTAEQRSALQVVLRKQYTNTGAQMSEKTAENIAKLSETSTFTIVTAHQPNLLLGPIYYIYKIISVLKMAQTANEKYKNLHIVPVFWLGSEDHDLEELNFFNAFNKKFVWETTQTGAVGRMQINDVQPLLNEFYTVLGESPNAVVLKNAIAEAFDTTKNRTIAQATFYLLNTLFAKYSLVIIDQDDADLKTMFAPFIQRELTERATEALVLQDIAAIEKAGFRGQAMPRNINLFYHTKNENNQAQRNRIVFENNKYLVLNTDISFSESEILEKLTQNPENFSPNVVLRPVFQEFVLPNIAYVGGGGELAYWQERRSVFQYFNMPMPMLIRRQSALIITAAMQKRIVKMGLPNYIWIVMPKMKWI